MCALEVYQKENNDVDYSKCVLHVVVEPWRKIQEIRYKLSI